MTTLKKILNFDTRNNIDYNKNPYQNCILNLRTSYKNILTMTLKSVELTTIKKYFEIGLDQARNLMILVLLFKVFIIMLVF